MEVNTSTELWLIAIVYSKSLQWLDAQYSLQAVEEGPVPYFVEWATKPDQNLPDHCSDHVVSMKSGLTGLSQSSKPPVLA